MRFRFLEMLVPSPRAQRRLQRIGEVTLLWVGYPFRLLFGLAKATGQLVASWWDSRNLRYLLQGLPALILTIGLMVVGAMIFFQDRAALAQDYEQAGVRALAEAKQRVRAGQDAKDALALAQTCYKRLSRPAPTPENSFHMAETYVLQRQYPAAASIQDSLAPLDPKKPGGYGPAHYEVARRILASNPKPKDILEAENHLMQAYQYNTEPYASYARALLFDVYRDMNRPDEAEEQLKRAVDKIGDLEPQLRVKLAFWYVTTGKRDQADDQAKRAIDTLNRKLEGDFTNFEARAGLIDALKFSGGLRCARGDYKKGKEDFARSRNLCQQGMAITTDQVLQTKYLTVLCYLFIAQFDGTLNDTNTTAAERFNLLEQALGLRPNDLNVIQRLGVFMQNSGPERDKAEKQIQQMIDEGKHLALGHMILGTAAWDKKDFVTAQYHWEKAFEQTDWSPLVANNLAWLLAFHSKPPDPERALMLVEKALSKAPEYPQFHGTRGHILAKLGRYREALPELEAAKPAYANIPKDAYQTNRGLVENAVRLYKALADVCSKLGMDEESKRYAKLADDLIKAAQPAAPGGGSPAPAAAPDAKTPSGPPAAAPPKPQ